MQINLTTAPIANASTEVSVNISLPGLGEGESFSARVIFSSAETVHLKTADGTLLRARMEGGLSLPEGSEVALTAVEKNGHTLRLRITEAHSQAQNSNMAAGKSLLVGETSLSGRGPALPEALADLAAHLRQAALPAAQKLELFMKAMTDFPGLSREEAAVQQALSQLLMTGEALAEAAALPTAAAYSSASSSSSTPTPLGQLLQQLAVLLEQAAAPAQSAPAATVNPSAQPVIADAATPLAPLFALFAPALTAQQTTPAAPPAPATRPNPEAAAQNLEIVIINAETAAKAENAAPNQQTNTAVLGAATAADISAPTSPAAAETQQPLALTSTPLPAETVFSTLPTETRRDLLLLTQRIVAELYPQGAQEPAVRDFINFVERLFARGGATARESGQTLHQSARELEVRLNLLQESLERSSLPHKEELLSHTNRLLQQAESLRQPERLLCLQLPIQFTERQQTVELYVYRRDKGGQKLDPRHATILLALNTEHLGRLEALVQVQHKDIHLRLSLARAEAVSFIQQKSGQLAQLLAEAGFRLSSAVVLPLTKETGPATARRALEDFQGSFGHQFDIQI